MSETICPICSGKNTSIFYEGLSDFTFKTTDKKFDLFCCTNCDAKFQHPFIPESEVGKYYPASTYQPFQLNSNLISPKLKYSPQSIYIRKLMTEHKPEDVFSLIDVGCGGGTFLMTVKKYFPNAELMGIDVSETAVQNLKSVNIDCVCSSLYDFNINKKFDYVVSSQVLEHLNQPYAFIKKIKELASNKSQIMIDVPASDSYSAKKYGRNWVHWDLPRHSILYSAKTLSYLLQEFETINLQHGGTVVAVLSSYKISKQQDIFAQRFFEKMVLKVITPLAKLFNLNFLFSDKLIWIGRIK